MIVQNKQVRLAARNQGFTLVELSVVMTIIGLMVGAIFAGQALIRSAQLQSISTTMERYRSAVQQFKDKYHYLPGDMPTATNFWGTDTGCPTTAAAAQTTPANATPKQLTCNGNGDGFIGDSTSTALGNTTHGFEAFRMWQHLANAGLMESEYTGAWSSRSVQEDPGINTPLGKIAANTYFLFYVEPTTGNANVFPGNYRHVIVYGDRTTTGNGTGPVPPYTPVLTAAEAFSLDQKIDDGLPGKGNIMTYANGLLPRCTNGATVTATYQTGNKGYSCSLIFLTGF